MSTTQLLSLVEYISYKVGCTYISDLPGLDGLGKMKAVHVLDDVSADVYPLKEWNDALQYIVHGSAELTAEEARAALMRKLCDRQIE
jgi:hypothetical protein|nr:hypothetical protein [uncultured Dysosmobacter sp.]